MEQSKCRLCGKPLTRGIFCFDCMRKEQLRRQQRLFFGKKAESTNDITNSDYLVLMELVKKYGLSKILSVVGNIAEKES